MANAEADFSSNRRSRYSADFAFDLVEQLAAHASGDRKNDNYLTFVAGRGAMEHCTFAELWMRSSRIAAELADQGATGKPVMILLPSGIDYVAAFFGCLVAGAIAVPVYPPANRFHIPRLEAVVRDCGATLALTSTTECVRMDALLQPGERLIRMLAVDTLDATASSGGAGSTRSAPRGLAFLQYTSGSTGSPKGVMVTRENLINHARILDRQLIGDVRGPFFSWLPLYHDLGLIGCMIQTAIWGDPFVFMTPAGFLQRPLSWLQAITAHSAVRSGGPNFAYDLCVQAFERRPVEGLDLSSWRVAFCGAEHILPATIRRFIGCFEPFGFDPGAFMPGYGLAEATLFVTGCRRQESAADLVVDPIDLERGLVTITPDEEEGRPLMSSGQTVPEIQVEIVDPVSKLKAGQGEVGEIWVSGKTMAAGYWNNHHESIEVFRANLNNTDTAFLRTGDLGFIHDKHLFITGRIKDIIIVDGRNIYPTDIEQRVQEASKHLRRHHVVAFSMQCDGEAEGIAIVGEVTRGSQGENVLRTEVSAIAKSLIASMGIIPDFIGLIRPGGLPKTSSGKLQRSRSREMLAGKQFEFLETWSKQKMIADV